MHRVKVVRLKLGHVCLLKGVARFRRKGVEAPLSTISYRGLATDVTNNFNIILLAARTVNHLT
jgi:hypothetical protein